MEITAMTDVVMKIEKVIAEMAETKDTEMIMAAEKEIETDNCQHKFYNNLKNQLE